MKKTFILLTVLLFFAVVTRANVSVAAQDNSQNEESQEDAGQSAEGEYTSLDPLNGKSIGVQTGTAQEQIVQQSLPDAELSFFNSYSDLVTALDTHKIEGFPGDELVLRLITAENPKKEIS